MMVMNKISRRHFLAATGAITGAALLNPLSEVAAKAVENPNVAGKKLRLAIVGTGGRGTSMWGYDLMKSYPDYIEFVGLCDKNEGRVETGKKIIGASCPTYTDFEKMMKGTRPDVLIVTTMDSTHHHFIIRGMELGADIITEKPMTTDEKKIQAILDAEKRTGKNCRVTFNYRYSPHRAKIWELLRAGEIGDITSVDFHWYLDTSHGADYFRRWHRLVECSGSLWVHKASHHFDLLNWWIDSDPESVYALGSLDHYGKNGTFRAENCRTCPHTSKCKFYYDITRNQNYMDFIVVKNPEIEYETNDKGQVTVMIEWRGFYHRIAQRFFKRPKVSAIKLDDYGSFLWQSINDQKTVHHLQSQFPKMEKPLARLIRFLEILKDHHLIELKEVY